MRLFLHLLILLRIAVPATTLAAPVSIVQDGNLISELGNLFSDALRRLTGNQPEPDAPAVMREFNAPQQNQVPRESDLKEYSDRTRLLADAVQSWVTQTCQLDDTQQTQLKELITKTHDEQQKKYARTDDPNRQNRPFGDVSPLLFMQSDGSGSDVTRSLLKSIQKQILNEVQKPVFDAAVNERREFHNAAFREYVVALFDQELFLTSEQRQQMLEQFSAEGKITSPFYAFAQQTYYLPYKSLSDVLKVGKAKFLDERQKERLKDLTWSNGNGNENYIMFQAAEGPEQWAETVKNSVVRQREVYSHATAVRIGYFEQTLKLTPEQAAYLTVAGKGAATDAIGEWKQTTQSTIDQMQEHMNQNRGNFAFSAPNISLEGLDKNEIWTNALSETGADKLAEDHKKSMRNAKAGCVMALLDQELWLMPQQRTAVLEFTEAAMPGNNNSSPWDQYVRELLFLAYPLHKAPEAKVQGTLSTQQQAVWKQLKDFFRWNKDNNYVEIPLKNQGGSFQIQLND